MSSRHMRLFSFVNLAFATILSFNSDSGLAGPREHAYKLFNRLTGVPPSQAELDEMTRLIQAGDFRGAAIKAVDSPYFYDVTIKNWASSFTNQEGNSRADLNDFSATIVGAVRDSETIPFDHVLWDDVVYTGKDGVGTAFSGSNNRHYVEVDAAGSLKDTLVQKVQSIANPLIPKEGVGGVLSTRAFGEAYLKAGTNRRAVRFVLMNFLCQDIDKFSDITIPDDRVRRDVSRAPGGESLVFKTKCVGCHSGMDPLAGAFAYHNFVEESATVAKVVFTPNIVQEKYNFNSAEFPDGFITENDSWENRWSVGQNSNVGWSGSLNGNGISSFGKMISETQQFPKCMAKRVFQKICLHDPSTADELNLIDQLAQNFSADKKFNMKNLFIETAKACISE